MKKMFVGLTACALIFTGCSKNEVLENTSEANAIRFSNLNSCFTKVADDNTSSSYKVFSVWSEFTSVWYMNTSVDGNNHCSSTKYWPEKGTLDFYAYSPISSSNFSIADEPTTSEVKGTYLVSSEAQEDFTIATPVVKQNGGTVGLNFSHMLSKITMSVSLLGLPEYNLVTKDTRATFTLPYNSAVFDVMSQNPMGDPGEKGTNVYKMLPKGNGSEKGGYLNVLPQPENNDGIFQLTISIKPENIDKPIIENIVLAPIELKTILPNGGKLEAGKWYQFAVTITGDAKDGGGDPVFKTIDIVSDIAKWDEELFNPTQPEVKP